jgi:hypothetical protein
MNLSRPINFCIASTIFWSYIEWRRPYNPIGALSDMGDLIAKRSIFVRLSRSSFMVYLHQQTLIADWSFVPISKQIIKEFRIIEK